MSEFIEAIHKGICGANLEYEKLSRGACWLNDSGCEGFMVASIARALYEQCCQGSHERSLRLERRFDEISGRVDIALLDECEKPICVIEAKRQWEKKPCLRDLNRIRNLVEHHIVSSGVFALLVTGEGAKYCRKLTNATNAVEAWCAEHPDLAVNICSGEPWDYPMTPCFGHEHPEWNGWKGTSVCIEISRP